MKVTRLAGVVAGSLLAALSSAAAGPLSDFDHLLSAPTRTWIYGLLFFALGLVPFSLPFLLKRFTGDRVAAFLSDRLPDVGVRWRRALEWLVYVLATIVLFFAVPPLVVHPLIEGFTPLWNAFRDWSGLPLWIVPLLGELPFWVVLGGIVGIVVAVRLVYAVVTLLWAWITLPLTVRDGVRALQGLRDELSSRRQEMGEQYEEVHSHRDRS